jgi:pimeloyl-ACP methyl ester carboxylesterase
VTASVVLVHGAWHGAWCFDPVMDRLRDAGIDAYAVDLPGHGADAGPLGDLHTDAARVRETLDDIGGECVLLGHSYGGAVVTEAGVHPSVRHIVYLCAFALDAGESCIGAAAAAAESTGFDLGARSGPHLAAAIVAEPDGTAIVSPDLAAACLFNDCDTETADWAVARLGPQPLVTMTDSPNEVAWRSRPSTYVVCTDDLAIPPEIQRVLARRCTSVVEWPTSHSPFLSAPDLVADLLSELARDA